MTSSYQPPMGTNYGEQASQSSQDLTQQLQPFFNSQITNENSAIQNASVVNNNNGQAFNALASFSKSLQEVTTELKKRERENQIAEAKALVLEGKITKDDLTQYYEDERQLRAQKKKLDQIAGDAAVKGAAYEPTSRLRKLNAWQQQAAVQMITKQLANEYESDLENSFQSDNKTRYSLPDGTQLTPMQARQGSRSQQQAMRAILKNEYLKKTGLIGIADEILVDQAQEVMDKADQKVDSTNARLYAINDSSKQIELLKNDFAVHRDPNQFLTGMVGLMTEEGVMTRRAALDEYFKMLNMYREKGPNGEQPLLSEAEYQALKNTPIEGGAQGETWGKRHMLRFRQLDELKAKADRDAYAQGEQDRRIRADKFQRDILAKLGSSSTDAEIKLALQAFSSNPDFKGIEPSMLQYELANNTVQAKALSRQEEQLMQLADANQLTSAVLAKYPLKLREKFASAAKTGDMFLSPDLKQYNDIIESFLKKETNTLPGGSLPDTALILQPIMVQRFQNRVKELRAVNTPNAEATAWGEIKKEYAASQADKSSLFYKSAKGYENVLPNSKALNATSKKADAELRRLGYQISGGKAGLYSYDMISKQELEKNELNYGKPGWTPPALAVYIGSKLNVNPMTVINAQRVKHGLKPLGLPKSLVTVEDKVRPGFQQFLNRYQSENRTVRALSTMGWQPDIVPKDLGPIIEKAARANGIEPSLLAGLLEKESSWRDDIISGRTKSKMGATGIAQFMPKTAEAMGVNPLDVNSSIDGAARYLASLRAKYDGSLNAALAHYGGYGGNANDPVFQREYLNPILRNATKFGYSSGLNDPGLMRGKFVSSITYDRNQPGIDVYFEDKNFTSVLPGKVKEVGQQYNDNGSGYGNYVVVESTDPATGKPVDVLYAHLASIDVQQGQTISSGTRIGIQGGTGSVSSVDGTIASIDFLAPAPRGSKSMKPYMDFESLRRRIAKQLQTR